MAASIASRTLPSYLSFTPRIFSRGSFCVGSRVTDKLNNIYNEKYFLSANAGSPNWIPSSNVTELVSSSTSAKVRGQDFVVRYLNSWAPRITGNNFSLLTNPLDSANSSSECIPAFALKKMKSCLSVFHVDLNSRRSCGRSTVSGGGSGKGRRHEILTTGLCLGFITSASLKSKEEEEDDTGQLIRLKIAQGIQAERNGEVAKAEKLYHAALTKAKRASNSKAVVYIYNQMANMNFMYKRFWKAENLFREVLRLLLAQGMEDDDPAIVEISLKLAQIMEAQNKVSEAKIGYLWCVSQSEKRLSTLQQSVNVADEELENVYALLGMCLGTTGRFLMSQSELGEAERMFMKALELCQKELAKEGGPHPQTPVLLCDLGTVNDLMKKYDKAAVYIEEAIKLSEDAPENIPAMMCNLASVELHRGNDKKARELYDRALKLAKKYSDEETEMQIEVASSKLKYSSSA